MKNTIYFNLILLSNLLFGQVKFDGVGEPVDSLNSANGQSYLTLHPSEAIISFTEEQSGLSSSSEIFVVSKTKIDSQEWQVRVFKDWLGEKGMISPLGHVEGGMYFNQVVFDKGLYYGNVFQIVGKDTKEVPIPFFRNRSPVQSGCLSRDGQYMILSLEGNNTYGVEDLYVVKRRTDGSWEQAKNLGYQLNTEFQEITPFLSEDNRTLFFATNGRGGEGSFDLFYTVRQDDSWRSWSEPVNLGDQINTSGAETSFGFRDGDSWAYYVSSQDSDGYGDIMRIRFREEIEADTTTIPEPVVQVQAENDSSKSLQVVDAQTGQALPSTLIFLGQNRSEPNGLFVIDSLIEQEVEIKSPGYLPKLLVIDERLSAGVNNVGLSAISKGNTIQLENVLFHRGTARMIEGSQRELDLVVEVMQDNPQIKILIKGHTDNTGDPVKNLQLSEERVRAVKEYILSQGINAYRVTGKGYGGNQPIASNETEETRKLNRRVEFEVIEE